MACGEFDQSVNVAEELNSVHLQLTCAVQELMQKLWKGAEFRKECSHFVEVIIGHCHILGVSAHIDDLWQNTSGECQIDGWKL